MENQIQKYINKQKSPKKEILEKIREIIKKSAPSAQETITYGVPSFKFEGKSIIYAAFKKHIGIYPEPETIVKFKRELEKYETAEGTVKFDLEKPIPYKLIEKIAKYKFRKQ